MGCQLVVDKPASAWLDLKRGLRPRWTGPVRLGNESEGAGDIGEGVEIPVEGEVGHEPGEPRGPIVMPVGGVDILIPPHMYEQQFSTSHTMTGQLVVRQLEDDPFSWPFVCMQKHEYYRAYSFVDPYGLEHKRCELSLPYTDYLEFTNHTMARNHMIASTSPLAFQFPGRNARNEYIGYERVVVNVFEPGERPNPYDPALPESIVDTVDMFDYMCSGNSTQLIDTRFPGWMGIKQRGKVRVCKTDISAGLDHYGAAEVWVAQFLLPDLPVGYTDFCPSTAPCEEPVTTMEVIYVAQWDFAPTAGDFVIEAWDRVYDMIDVGGPSFPVPAHFEF